MVQEQELLVVLDEDEIEEAFEAVEDRLLDNVLGKLVEAEDFDKSAVTTSSTIVSSPSRQEGSSAIACSCEALREEMASLCSTVSSNKLFAESGAASSTEALLEALVTLGRH